MRCGEALALKRQHLNLEATTPKLVITGESAGARKSPGEVYIRKQHVDIMRKWLRQGISSIRQKKHKHGKGKHKIIAIKQTYIIPNTGYMFPSRKKRLFNHSCTTMLCTIMCADKPLNFWRISRRQRSNGAQRLASSGHIQGGQP